MGLFGDLFSSKSSSTQSTNYNDSSTNLNAEGQGISQQGAGAAARDSSIALAGGSSITLNSSLDADVFTKAADALTAANALNASVAQTGISAMQATGQQSVDATLKAAASFVDNNAKLAGQSMDTALAFGNMNKPAAATFTDAIPIVAIAAALAIIGYAMARKKT